MLVVPPKGRKVFFLQFATWDYFNEEAYLG
jgi:hypothetical protein